VRASLVLLPVCAALAVGAPAAAFTLGKPVNPCWLLAHQAPDPTAQTITVVNQARVKPGNLCRVEYAVQQQALQLRAAWATPPIVFGPGGWNVYLKVGHVLGPWGFHANPQIGAPPYAIVWTAGMTYEAWSSVLSHEIMETLVDPYQLTYSNGSAITTTAARYTPSSTQVEVADPVHVAYALDGIYVADFTLPGYWTDGPGPWDLMRALTGPWQSVPT
jgi:hypothetical protein